MPLVVKWADTEKERQARRAQKAQSQSSNATRPNSIQQPSVFGALPMGYMPPYDGYGYQVLRVFLACICRLTACRSICLLLYDDLLINSCKMIFLFEVV